jgi:hypothetical protein
MINELIRQERLAAAVPEPPLAAAALAPPAPKPAAAASLDLTAAWELLQNPKQIKEEVSHNKLRVEQQLEQQSTPSAPTPVKSESTTTPIDEQKTLDRRSVTSRSLASLITHGLTPISTSTSTSPQEKVIMLEQRCEVLEKELLNARKEHISDAATAKAKEVQYATELEELRHRCTELDQTIETLYAKIAQFHWERDEDHSNCMNEKCQAEFTLFNRR